MTPAGEAALLYKRQGRAAMPRTLRLAPQSRKTSADFSRGTGTTMDYAQARQAMVDRQNGGADIGKRLIELSDRMFAWWHRVRGGGCGK